jgi:hypothetical protein
MRYPKNKELQQLAIIGAVIMGFYIGGEVKQIERQNNIKMEINR